VFCDLAMAYDPAIGRADLVFDGRGFPLDRTAATALIISIGSERRADPDDVLPGTEDAADVFAAVPEARPNPRRGWVCDPSADSRIGSRFWLLDDAKQTEENRLRAVAYGEEAVAWMPAATGVMPGVDASWIHPNTLAILVQAGGMTLRLPVSIT
jgi:phage gp46-like protein